MSGKSLFEKKIALIDMAIEQKRDMLLFAVKHENMDDEIDEIKKEVNILKKKRERLFKEYIEIEEYNRSDL